MTIPACPVCEQADHVARVDHPTGRFECGACHQLFNGGGLEALALAGRRQAHHRRRDHPEDPAPAQRTSREAS